MNPQLFISYETYERKMKREDRATISVSKKTHADFEKYRATLSAEREKVQTQDDVVKALLAMVN
jgi:septal ring factor EnvC (AmiA/AmiB activator)